MHGVAGEVVAAACVRQAVKAIATPTTETTEIMELRFSFPHFEATRAKDLNIFMACDFRVWFISSTDFG
jgi:hypothetical protein